MGIIAFVLTLITCLLHGIFFLLEMFLWTHPIGRKIFHMNEEKAMASKVLAANQGLYNGMLAVGLFLSLMISDPVSALAIRRYCLGFIFIVGCYGAYSLKTSRVFVVQALPALLALVATEMSN